MTATTADFIVRTTVDIQLTDGTSVDNRCVLAVRDWGVLSEGRSGDEALLIELQDDHGAQTTIALSEVAHVRPSDIQRPWEVAGGLADAA